jgi:WD40 repeat protein
MAQIFAFPILVLFPLLTWADPSDTLRGHRGTVSCVVFSPDGKLVASGAKDGVLIVWEGGKPLIQIPGHKDMLIAVAYSPNGKLIAATSSGPGNTPLLWRPFGRTAAPSITKTGPR